MPLPYLMNVALFNAIVANAGYCLECLHGLWGVKCDRTCSPGCLAYSCGQSDGYCLQCGDGFWGDNCDKLCSESCPYNSCRKADGICFVCSVTSVGLRCKAPCPTMCEDACEQYTGKCLDCKQGHWGDTCDKMCSQRCFSNSCDKINGSCLSCKDGYWGDSCQFRCNNECRKDCTQSTGYCICKDGYFGNSCGDKCFAKCKTCNSSTVCTTCPKWFWGETCDECDQNCADACDQNTGHCKCKNGYFNSNGSESKCTACPKTCQDGSCEPLTGVCVRSSVEPDDVRGLYKIALAGVGGVLVLLIAVVGTVGVFKRKRQRLFVHPISMETGRDPVHNEHAADIYNVIIDQEEGRANTATGQHLSTTGLPIQESHVINPTTDNTEMTSAYLVPDFKEDLYSTECYRDLLPAGPIAAVEHDYYNEGGHYVNQA